MVLIDSDIIIWILRGNNDYKNKFENIVTEFDGYIFITPIQFAEIYAGMREKEKTETEIFLNSLRSINIDNNIGKLAGEYLKKYQQSHSVSLSDSLMAASSKIFALKLWTDNKKHYPMLKRDDFFE